MTKITTTNLPVSTTVYSLYYPEVQDVVEDMTQSFNHDMYKEAWTKKQDGYHDAFLRTWQNWSRSFLYNVNWDRDFLHSYPCNGSSEAIRESLAQYAADCAVQGRAPCIHVFEGEYEGYRAVAEGYGIKVFKWPRSTWYSFEDLPDFKPGDCFYLSAPSSIDGNVWEHTDEFLKSMATHHPQVKVRLDLCYLGTTVTPFEIKNAGLFNVDMIFFSLSKVFGVYYHRIGGVFSKHKLPGLFGNKWFKNLFSLQLGTELLKKFNPTQLPQKYSPLQAEAIKELEACLSRSDIQASDVVLLANYEHHWADDVDWEFDHRRGEGYRYCLTPYMGRKLGQ